MGPSPAVNGRSPIPTAQSSSQVGQGCGSLLFAYGARDGVTGFTSNANPPGIVGPASKPQENPNPWNAACDRMRNQSQHPGGLQVGLVDGSARFISASIDANAWWAMCTIGGGETLRD